MSPMCGRYTLHTSRERLLEHFQLQSRLELVPRFNIAPSQAVPAVRQGEEQRELVMLRWGLIPAWAKEEKSGYRMINARAETVASKPAFRSALRYRRCLLPADGFYEWRAGPRGKQPYYIRLREGDVFAFAGLWEHWEGPDGKVIESCTIIVTNANEVLRPVHDRMPVILDPADYHRWLDPSCHDPSALTLLLQLYPAERG
jgi:putative SOS response-associated peptidase YedK